MNKLVMTGLEFVTDGKEAVAERLATWVVGTGAKNVSSGVIRCDVNPSHDIVVYSAHFDSSHWTGINFNGFGVKHPGEPQTP